jgi:hypothetical protein
MFRGKKQKQKQNQAGLNVVLFDWTVNILNRIG